MLRIVLTVALLLALEGLGPAGLPTHAAHATTLLPDVVANLQLPSDVGQCLVAIADAPASSTATVWVIERSGPGWTAVFPPFPASIGRRGVAASGKKREGDGMSPGGEFPLGLVFGYAASSPTRLPYRQMTAEDVWVDDPESPDYNVLTTRGATKAKSFETMKRTDNLYKLGLVVEYNTKPIVKGHGSAIFVHLWGGPGHPTAGCLAFAETQMLRVLAWFDPAKHPHVAFIAGATPK